MFNELYARASFDAALLVDKILTDGVNAARATGFIGKKSKRVDLDHRMDSWEAYTTLCLDGSPTAEALLDVAIFAAAGGAFFVASVGLISGRADEVAEVLKSDGFNVPKSPSWWAETKWDNVVPLIDIPITNDTRVEDIEAGCRGAFEAIGPHLRALIDFAAK